MAQITIHNTLFVIPEPDSPCELWRSYYAQLARTTGKANARTIWLLTWQQNGSTACTTNPTFNKWLEKNSLDVTNASTRAIADLSDIGGNILGFGKNMTRIVSSGIPIVLGSIALIILILLINAARKSDVNDLAALHPFSKAFTSH